MRKRAKRLRKGTGSVVPYGKSQWRARKRRRGHPDLFGTVRDSWAEAYKDLSSLRFGSADTGVAPTLRDFMQSQLEGRRKEQVSYSTWKHEETTWRTRIFDSELGRMRLDTILAEHCQEFIDSLRKLSPARDKSGKTVWAEEELTGRWRRRRVTRRLQYVMTDEPINPRKIGSTLHTYFELARLKRFRYVAHNPMNDVEYPKIRKGTRRAKALTPAKAKGLGANLLKFITALHSQGSRFEAMVLVKRDTGLRRGELCGLLRSAVRMASDGPYIVVENALAIGAGGYKDSSTKSDKVRELPIDQETYDRIMALPARKDSLTGQVYAFSTESGRPVRPDNWNRDFRKFREAAGMPDLKPHQLRHTYISLLLRGGVDQKTIQANVGHATERMIMQIYGETYRESQRESVSRFRRVLAEANTE